MAKQSVPKNWKPFQLREGKGPWIAAAVFFLIAYGFVSLAINSGAFIFWLLGVFFVGWSVVELTRAIRSLHLK